MTSLGENSKAQKLPGIQAIALPQLSCMQWQFIESDV